MAFLYYCQFTIDYQKQYLIAIWALEPFKAVDLFHSCIIFCTPTVFFIIDSFTTHWPHWALESKAATAVLHPILSVTHSVFAPSIPKTQNIKSHSVLSTIPLYCLTYPSGTPQWSHYSIKTFIKFYSFALSFWFQTVFSTICLAHWSTQFLHIFQRLVYLIMHLCIYT